jgi:hypothetical protein
MNKIVKTILGLIIDDWWLAIGILLSILLTSIALKFQMSPFAASWLLFTLIIVTLILSLTMEFRKKANR